MRIAVVAFNYKLSLRALRVIAENDNSEIERIYKDKIVMKDGNEYHAFPTYNHVRGHIIDQFIVVDDSRWEVYSQQLELIDWIRYRLDCVSCVPEEFQELKYEW